MTALENAVRGIHLARYGRLYTFRRVFVEGEHSMIVFVQGEVFAREV